MKEIPFFKFVASGNDFLVIDHRQKGIQDPTRFAHEICDRHTGVGADGVLLLETSKQADFRMRIINSDGSEAEACGNGFRCIALFAHEKLGFSKAQRFESVSGMIQATVQTNRVRVRLVNPSNWKNRNEIEVSGRKLHYDFIHTGVPHAVIFVESLDQIPVSEIGREIRFHSHFKPAGTNVNFVEVTGPGSLRVRTYERGVEDETLACGTGSTASAIVSSLAGYTQPPVEVKTKSGEILTVDFQKKGNEIKDVYLEGEARFVFEGSWRHS